MSGLEGRCGHADGAEPLPRVVSSRLVYSGKIISLRVDEIALPKGGTATREVVQHRGAVVVIAIDNEERVYLVRQYRHAIGRSLVELPAGCLEAGEGPLAAAKRELREEVGLRAKRWKGLGCFYSSPGFADELLHVFVARDLEHTDTDPDFDEDLTVITYPLGQMLENPSELTDAKTLAAFSLLRKEPDGGDRS